MRKWLVVGLFVCICLLPGLGRAEGQKFILLSSTIGPIDAGIVAVLEDGFEKETGIRVRHVGAGTGAALDIAKQGSVDLVMVHAKSLEEKFVASGFGTERIDLMHNDLVIMGPPGDPAGIKGMQHAPEALKGSKLTINPEVRPLRSEDGRSPCRLGRWKIETLTYSSCEHEITTCT